MLYVNLFFPTAFWGGGGTGKTYFKKIEVAQRAVLKVATFKPFRFSTKALYEFCDVLTVWQLFVLNIILKQHSKLHIDPSILKKRRSHFVCTPLSKHKTSFVRQFFPFLGPYIYNRINKITKIYTLTRHKCKQNITSFLKTLSYEETEELLEICE